MRYAIIRTIQAVLTVVVVVVLSFFLVRLMPGGPMDYLQSQLAQQATSTAAVERQMEAYINVQPNQPLHEQFISYMASTLTGDLGTSTWYDQSVSSILIRAVPWTVFLMGTSLVIYFTIGVLLGAAMAYAEGSRFDTSMTALSISLVAIPFYLFALIILFVLGYQAGLFPISGRLPQGTEPTLSMSFFIGLLRHGTLPIAAVVITGFGGVALNMRANSIRILGEDYLRVARLRGLSERRIASRYVARNAVLPLYTGFLIAIGNVFGGSVILETIFNYPGVGYYLFQALETRDYPLMMGAFILITVAVVIALFIADITYGKIDPRAKGGDSRESY